MNKIDYEKQIVEGMSSLVELGRIGFYVETYRNKVSEADIIGVIVSKALRWNGEEIVKCLLSALEDSNFHSLAEEIEKVCERNTKPRIFKLWDRLKEKLGPEIKRISPFTNQPHNTKEEKRNKQNG